LKSEITQLGPHEEMDLEEVDLVDVEGVRSLNACESAGIAVIHYSAYVREWMLRERGS